MLVLWPGVGPTFTHKYLKKVEIRLTVMDQKIGRFVLKSFLGKKIYKIDGYLKSLRPEFCGKRRMSKKGKTSLDNMLMFLLNDSVLLMCMSTRESMGNTKFLT